MELTTILVAIYGAILSTVNIILFVIEHRISLVIELSTGYLVGQGYKDENSYLFWNAYNKGAKSIKLSTVGFRVKGVKETFQLPYQLDPGIKLPYIVKPSESYSCFTTTKQVTESLGKKGCSGKVKITGYFTDAIKNIYYSKPFQFDTLKK